MVLGCLCVDFWLWSFASERELDMKQIFRVIVCVALFAGLPAFADFDKGREAFDKRDYVTALREWQLIAKQGHAEAQYFLGWMYASGTGVSQNYSEAAKWYIPSAEQGHLPAQLNLGKLYANGQGVIQDYLEAVKWFRLASEQDFQWAQFSLGVMYANGDGVPKDNVLAYMWANLAAAKGDEEGIGLRDNMAKKMTSEQILEAQKLSRECIAKDYKGC